MFDSLDLDVEPHTLPLWRGGGAAREQLMRGLLALLDAVRSQKSGLPLGAALNPIYAKLTLPDEGNFLATLAHRLDTMALMAYRDRADATLKWAQPAIDVFEQARVPWRSGVLTYRSSEARISFFGSSRAAFISEMVRLDQLLRDKFRSGSYQGLIFEDYRGLRAILEQ